MTDVLEARLAVVRQRILGRAPATLEDILKLLNAADRDSLSQADRDRVYIMIHNLAGVSGTVGLIEVSRTAKDLERTVAAWLGGAGPRADWMARFEALAAALSPARSR